MREASEEELSSAGYAKRRAADFGSINQADGLVDLCGFCVAVSGPHAFLIDERETMVVVRYCDVVVPNASYAIANLDVVQRDHANDLACLEFRDYSRVYDKRSPYKHLVARHRNVIAWARTESGAAAAKRARRRVVGIVGGPSDTHTPLSKASTPRSRMSGTPGKGFSQSSDAFFADFDMEGMIHEYRDNAQSSSAR